MKLTSLKLHFRIPTRIKTFLICLLVLIAYSGMAQKLPKALIITGNGNVPKYKEGFPPWIHEFHNEKVVDILKGTAVVDTTSDLNVLQADRLRQYDLIISNSLFLTPNEEQLNVLYDFVANGKAYFTIHCGILTLLNWDKYEEFIGGIFIGGPASVPTQFNVITNNTEFWGYEYSFRKQTEHPVSVAVDDFVIKDELYHFQPSTRDFHVIARAENLPVMWWHPVGKGKVMSLTLGHDEEAKNNAGYQGLLKHGVQWLTGMPLIHGKPPKVVSTRNAAYENFMTLSATTGMTQNKSVRFRLEHHSSPEVFTPQVTEEGKVKIKLTGKNGYGEFTVSASETNGFTSSKTFQVRVVKDGVENIAAYHGNTAISSSNENQSGVFNATNAIDADSSTRWSSAAADSAWLDIDLQKIYTLKKMVLKWEASYASHYQIKGSADGRNWSTVGSVSDGDGNSDTLTLNNARIRYLRIQCTKRARDKWGYSLYEVEVYQQ